MNPYLVFLLYLLAILGFVFAALLLNRLLGPKPAATPVKLEPFECGATPLQAQNVRAVPVKYYALAIMFVLFDLETVFLFVWALGARADGAPLSGWMLATFALFAALLVLILAYVWKSGILADVTE